jgi:hypothetical protein
MIHRTTPEALSDVAFGVISCNSVDAVIALVHQQCRHHDEETGDTRT